MFSKKAQVSIEAIILVIFLIVFINYFSIMTNNTFESLEINKIKTQQNDILENISYVLEYEDIDLDTYGFNDYNLELKIPYIILASKKASCNINYKDNQLKIITKYNDFNISSTKNLYLDNIQIDNNFYCGSTINCNKGSTTIRCE